MAKIVLVGAGSHSFARKLIGDILTWPSLNSGTICLMDIDIDKLKGMTDYTRKAVKELGLDTTIESTTDLRRALQGADYVTDAIRRSSSRAHVEIPARYGINQAVGDTTGPGGVFYFLLNAPVVVEIAQTMDEVCPNALLLNYTNPMVMLSWAVDLLSEISYVGLCHSIQGTSQDMAKYIGAPYDEVRYWAAGINHMAWFLDFTWKGQDAYPLLLEAMSNPDIYEQDIVKFELLKHFGRFVSESSIHNSEYMPYFRRTPEMIDRYTSEQMWGVAPKGVDRVAMWQERRKAQDEAMREMIYGDAPLDIERSHEFCTEIINAIESNVPIRINGNVPNTGLITNLPQGAVVEVPILVDGMGLHPCYVGELPPALAGLNRSSLVVQELAVQGYVQGDRELIYQALQMDPLTASLLTLDEIRQMGDEMFAADAEWITI